MADQVSQTYDAALLLKDAGAITATGVATVASVARVVDLGPARNTGRVIVDAATMVVNDTDEAYDVVLEGCNAIGFGSGVVELARLALGAAAVRAGGALPGRYEMPFTTAKGGTLYRYVRIKTTIGGTTPSINFTAFIAKSAR